MATVATTKYLRIGYWGFFSITQPNRPSDTLAISDSILVRVVVKLADSIGIRDTNPARQTITDIIVFFEGISAWVRGAMKTIFITDDRYFNKRG